MKKVGLICVWLGTLLVGSLLQHSGFIPAGFFPEYKNYFPDFPGISLQRIRDHVPARPVDHEGPDTSPDHDKEREARPDSLQNQKPGLNPKTTETSHSLWNRDHKKYLADLFYKLDHAKDKRVRILHLGDSILWAETVAATMRRELQKKYGDGGRGYVSLQDTPDTVMQDHKNSTRHGFKMHSAPFAFGIHVMPELGYAGRTFEPESDQSTTIHSVARPDSYWEEVTFQLRRNSSDSTNITIETERNGTKLKPDSQDIQFSKRPCGVIRFKPGQFDSIAARFTNKPYVDGMLLERNSGVSYSVLVRKGIHQSWMRAISQDNLECGFQDFAPDLLIFEFALNESASIDTHFDGYNPTRYENDLREYYARLRKVLPNVPVLMIGPVDRIKDADGVLVPVPAQNQVREVQRKIANEFGFLFFDPAASPTMPAPAAMFAQGMLLTDYLHLTPHGGEFLGSLVAGELLAGITPGEVTSSSPVVTESKHEERTITFPSIRYAWFLLIVLGVFSLARKLPYFRLIFVTIASCYFYASWEAWALFLLLFSCGLDYIMGRLIERTPGKFPRMALLGVSLSANLGLLMFFKYFTFLAKSLNAFLDPVNQLPLYQVLLPPGISFYTFQSLSYTIDVYRGEMKAERNPLRLFFFVSFFPQLVAGPIVRAHHFLRDLKQNVQHFLVTQAHFQEGVFLICRGLTKKILADWLALNCVDRIYQNPSMFSTAEILVGFYAYALQIYGDFSGYTDIAIGSARLFGFRLTLNFLRPYQSGSITEFWRRWHISLGSWFRDYLYFPLGGSRKRIYRNLFITMLIAGVWHGAGWNFILWGAFHGAFLLFERATGLDKSESTNPFVRIIRVLVTFHIVWIGWIFFRVGSWETFAALLSSLGRLEFHASNVSYAALIVLVLGYVIHLTPLDWRERGIQMFRATPWAVAGLFVAVITTGLSKVAVQRAVPFIYFQF
ncbi:MAG: hypothetical protein K8S54_11365 [Spirochaetia bacterium]|nr:hypothetical protein [Spirochaetia bacterium]